MNKETFFHRAMQSGAYTKKGWVINAFAVSKSKETDPTPFRIDYLDSVTGGWAPDDTGRLVFTPFTDHPAKTPLFDFKERLTITAEDIPNVTGSIDTTYGNLLVNWMCLVRPFGNKIPYMTDKVTVKRIEKIVEQRLASDPEVQSFTTTDRVSGDTPIYVSEWVRCAEALGQLAGLSSLCVPSATSKAVMPPPGLVEYRNKLYVQFADRLHDPATIAEIDRLLVAYDKLWLADDDIVNFYIKAKSYEVTRKKMFLSHGLEAGFSEGGEFDVIPQSLYEGWDLQKLPAMVNSLRDGSYNRGAMTALGGWSVKFFYRIMQNARISVTDCGSTQGVPHVFREDNHGQFEGYYQVMPKGIRRLTAELTQELIGKTVVVRSPMYCQAEGSSFCERCLGDKNAQNPTGLAALAADVGSQFMLTRMGQMHGVSLKTVRYDVKLAMS